MVNRDRLIKLFMELVQIDSVSREERLMADRLTEELKTLGGKVREDNTGERIQGSAGNLIAEFSGSSNYPVLILSAHMDRVEPGRGIKPVIRDNYIMSEGNTILAGDDVIGITSIIEALKILKENGIAHGPLKVIFSVAEEVGLLGAKELDPSELKADYGFVYDVDGDVGTIVYQAPSQVKFNAVIRGRAAHAGMNPEEGINAIKIASKAISEMKLGRVDEETTVNIGVIKGGRAINIVPDLVELEGEIRSHREENLLRQQEHMQTIIERAAAKYHGQVNFEIERLYSGFVLDRESDIIRLVANSAARLGIPVKYMVSGGGSDANIFNQRGLPTVNLGTGMEKVHSTDERVKIENLVRLVEFTINIIKNSKEYK